ncbi:MAG: hypothetical protein IRZ10_11970 [Thermoflavifilum sp.]|nr:hypothetical protein [Thermoflavifilum sp.]MCL6515117.1 hypothetical protein [Alicyclobacillus sp.]
MPKRLIAIVCLLCGLSVTGCSFTHGTSTHATSANTTAQPVGQRGQGSGGNGSAYLPVETLWDGQAQSLEALVGAQNIHHVHFPGALPLAYTASQGLLVSVEQEDKQSQRPGLYLVDVKTGAVTQLTRVNAPSHQEIWMAVADDQWLVYGLGSDLNSTVVLYAYDWRTHQTFRVTGEDAQHDPGVIVTGMTLDGNVLFWSEQTQSGDFVTSQIHSYDLKTRRDGILLQLTNSPQDTAAVPGAPDHGIINAMAGEAPHLILSIYRGYDYAARADADIYEYDLTAQRMTRILHLPSVAAPISASGDLVAMNVDYDPDSSEVAQANGGIYLYHRGDSAVYKLSPDGTVGTPTQNDRFVTWTGASDGRIWLYEMRTHQYAMLLGSFPAIFGSMLVWTQGDDLDWAQLPQ